MEYIDKLLDTRRKKKRAQALKNKGLGVTEIARRLGVTKQLANYYLKGYVRSSPVEAPKSLKRHKHNGTKGPVKLPEPSDPTKRI